MSTDNPNDPQVNPEAVRAVGDAPVAGERDIPSVNKERSLQSRAQNMMALAVVSILGGGFLWMYYAASFHKQAEAQQKVAAEHSAKAAGEMKLPPLGEVEGPRAATTDSSTPPDKGPTTLADVVGAPPLDAPGAAPRGAAAGQQGAPTKTPGQLALERKLMPSVFARSSESASPTDASASVATGFHGATPAPSSVPANTGGQVDSYLSPSVTASTQAQVLSSRRFVIPKGNFVDCTLETAVSSELPGLVTCITAFDIYGADGKVVLIERGSKLTGESKGSVSEGMSRLFILWDEARTPTGVVVQLASPGTDELGRSGVTGYVDNHFWARFGAAIMVSIVDGVIQGLVAHEQSSGSAIVVNPTGTQQVTESILRNTINIPPTININQGTRIQIIVARDVDFRSVYELRIAATASP